MQVLLGGRGARVAAVEKFGLVVEVLIEPAQAAITLPVTQHMHVLGGRGARVASVEKFGLVVEVLIEPAQAAITLPVTQHMHVLGGRGARVASVEKFGLFVEVLPGKQGLVHSSELDVDRGVQMDSFSAGDAIDVKLLEVRAGKPLPQALKPSLRLAPAVRCAMLPVVRCWGKSSPAGGPPVGMFIPSGRTNLAKYTWWAHAWSRQLYTAFHASSQAAALCMTVCSRSALLSGSDSTRPVQEEEKSSSFASALPALLTTVGTMLMTGPGQWQAEAVQEGRAAGGRQDRDRDQGRA